MLCVKVKLNPDVAYLTGLWKTRRSREGLGVAGGIGLREIFVREASRTLGKTPSDFRRRRNEVYVFDPTARRQMERFIAEQLDIFKWKNAFSQSYLAGIFDGVGGVDEEKGLVYIVRASAEDQMLLERLGFRTRWARGKLLLIKPKEFARFILGRMRNEELKSRLSALVRSGNERDPR